MMADQKPPLLHHICGLGGPLALVFGLLIRSEKQAGESSKHGWFLCGVSVRSFPALSVFLLSVFRQEAPSFEGGSGEISLLSKDLDL